VILNQELPVILTLNLKVQVNQVVSPQILNHKLIAIFYVVWERMQRVYGIHYLKEKRRFEDLLRPGLEAPKIGVIS
jgi:hypothetical protein